MVARKTTPTDFGARVRVFSARHNIPIKKLTRELGLSYAHVLDVMKGTRPGHDAKKALTAYMDEYEKTHREEV